MLNIIFIYIATVFTFCSLVMKIFINLLFQKSYAKAKQLLGTENMHSYVDEKYLITEKLIDNTIILEIEEKKK